MPYLQKVLHQTRQLFFQAVHNNSLIYNTCWEDPRIDRALLELDSDSSVLMLTSAGCNALDYLIEDPESIVCVDSNYRQNALLALKIALFNNNNWNLLFELFGHGATNKAHLKYQHVQRLLPGSARSFWNQNFDYFEKNPRGQTFYFRGSTGTVAWLMQDYLRHRHMLQTTQKLLHAQTLDEQRTYYETIEQKLWPPLMQWALSRQGTMSFLGVPPSQTQLINSQYHGGLAQFLRDTLRHIFTDLPIGDNYFWHVYLNGYYTEECAPRYLKKEHFTTIRDRIHRIQMFTGTLLDYLVQTENRFSHFVLLDHMDWLAANEQQTLENEWIQLLKHATSGARILFRSAGFNHQFLPDFIHDHVTFEDAKTRQLHHQDRVGTYGSTHLAIVKQPMS